MVRYKTNIKEGLTQKQVDERIADNLVNYNSEPKTKTIGQIIRGNLFTYFNFLNLALSLAVFLVGTFTGYFFEGLKNSLFLGVVICNTVIATLQEIYSKKIVDKLSVLSEAKVSVVRDGKMVDVGIYDIVLDDVMYLSIGKQVVCDSYILDGEVEVNESFITGEQDSILMKKGDLLKSGSFIVSGTCYARVEHVGKDNYISEISSEAKYIKKSNSVIMNAINTILKVISVAIVPLGILLFFNQTLVSDYNYTTAVFNTVGGLIGMIPEGLILLTSSVMAVSIIRLYKYKVLIQNLYSIENLARVDVICLDKTGTITEGAMEFVSLVPYGKNKEKDIAGNLSIVTASIPDTSPTFMAIKSVYNGKVSKDVVEVVPFSSKRKYSAVSIKKKGAYFIGAPEFVLKEQFKSVKDIVSKYQVDYRVLVFAKAKSLDSKEKEVLAFLLIRDKIRKEAASTIAYFNSQNVKVKIISGDNLMTVTTIARRAGLEGLNGVDCNTLDDKDFKDAVEKYDIFARVTPNDKKKLIMALKANGHTVAMTGDGVNDVLALKEADSSIAMASGSDATKNVSEIVLLDSNFDALPHVVLEGRRTINNIKRSASLLLMKTVFTVLLIIICIVTRTEYFFVPIQLSLLNFFNIGAPSFILALEPNKNRVTGNFLLEVFANSLPTALTVVINIVFVTLCRNYLALPNELATWLNVFLTSGICFIFLYKMCKPFNWFRRALFSFMTIGFVVCAIVFHEFFDLMPITFYGIILFLIFFICSIFIYQWISMIVEKFLKKYENKKKM